MKFKSILLTATITGVALSLSACGDTGGATGGQAASTASPTPAEPAVKVSATQIASDYAANEISADGKYKGKAIEVTGVVEGIESDITDQPVVQLTGKDFIPVQLAGVTKDVAAGLVKGKKITAACTGAGEVASFPMLDSCTIK